MSWVAVAIGGSAVLGYFGSQNAAQTQADAAGQASQTQLGMFNQTQKNLQPWLTGGQAANDALLQLLGITPGSPGTPGTPGKGATAGHYVTDPYGQADSGGVGALGGNRRWVPATAGTGGTPGTPATAAAFDPNAPLAKGFTLADFQASPAYNFNLQQGQMAIDKASNARGNYYAPQTLQDISKFSQGLASNEFQNAFSNYNTMQNNLFSRLQTISGQGANAGANLGGFGAQTAGQIGANQIGAGNALAAGQVGGINAITGAVGDYTNYSLMQQLMKNQAPTYAPMTYGGNPGE